MMQKKRSTVLVIVLVVSAILLAACGSDSDDKSGDNNTNANMANNTPAATSGETAPGEYQTISIDEFADIVENRADDYQIINVHIPYAGEVPNTDANIPYNDLDALTAAIPSKDSPVILYCRSGNMSEQATRALVEQGYTHVWDVLGGMVAWQSSGRDLVDK
jgi:rhodanese-related sulfurtransferase